MSENEPEQKKTDILRTVHTYVDLVYKSSSIICMVIAIIVLALGWILANISPILSLLPSLICVGQLVYDYYEFIKEPLWAIKPLKPQNSAVNLLVCIILSLGLIFHPGSTLEVVVGAIWGAIGVGYIILYVITDYRKSYILREMNRQLDLRASELNEHRTSIYRLLGKIESQTEMLNNFRHLLSLTVVELAREVAARKKKPISDSLPDELKQLFNEAMQSTPAPIANDSPA